MSGKGSYEIKFEERQIIEDLLSKKYTVGGIATCLGRSHSGVKAEIRRNGGSEHYTAEKGQTRADYHKQQRVAKLNNGFTEAQVEMIRQGAEQGMSINKICNLIGCSYFTIRSWLDRNKVTFKRKNYTAFDERITTLEQQVEILFDLFKELKDAGKNK